MPGAEPSRIPRSVRRALLVVLGAAFLTGAIYIWRTGAVTPAGVLAWLRSLGPAAPLIFVAAFVGSAFVGFPSMVLVVGGRLAFGPVIGFATAMTGGLLAVTIPFVLARRLGRTRVEPWRPKNRHLARALGLVERHPLRAVLLLRLVLWFNSPLSYAMAFTPIRLRTYVAGCACALAPVVAFAMLATGWLT